MSLNLKEFGRAAVAAIAVAAGACATTSAEQKDVLTPSVTPDSAVVCVPSGRDVFVIRRMAAARAGAAMRRACSGSSIEDQVVRGERTERYTDDGKEVCVKVVSDKPCGE